MSEIDILLEKLTLEDDDNIISITINELNLSNIRNSNIVSEFYILVDKIKKLLMVGTNFSNKDMIICLIKFKWIFDKIIESILRTSINYFHDITANGLDKLTPEILIKHLQNNLSKEQFNLIYTNYKHYVNKFNL